MKLIQITSTFKQDFLAMNGVKPIKEFGNDVWYIKTPKLSRLLETYEIRKSFNYKFRYYYLWK